MTISFYPAPENEFCVADNCDRRVKNKYLGYRSAECTLHIMDQPDVFLCMKCAKEWAEMWEEFGGGEPLQFHSRRYNIKTTNNKGRKRKAKVVR